MWFFFYCFHSFTCCCPLINWLLCIDWCIDTWCFASLVSLFFFNLVPVWLKGVITEVLQVERQEQDHDTPGQACGFCSVKINPEKRRNMSVFCLRSSQTHGCYCVHSALSTVCRSRLLQQLAWEETLPPQEDDEENKEVKSSLNVFNNKEIKPYSSEPTWTYPSEPDEEKIYTEKYTWEKRRKIANIYSQYNSTFLEMFWLPL